MKPKINKKYLLNLLLTTAFVLSVFLLPSGLKFVRRMLNWPQSFSTIHNTDSRLLPLLLQQDDFSKEWQWDLVITNQSNGDPLRGENRILEFATKQFVGLYKKHSVRVVHYIYRYENRFSLSSIEVNLNLKSIGLLDVNEKFTFNLPETFNQKLVGCYHGIDKHQSPVSRCIFIIQNNNILERVDVDIYNDMTKELIKQATIAVHNYLKSKKPSE